MSLRASIFASQALLIVLTCCGFGVLVMVFGGSGVEREAAPYEDSAGTGTQPLQAASPPSELDTRPVVEASTAKTSPQFSKALPVPTAPLTEARSEVRERTAVRLERKTLAARQEGSASSAYEQELDTSPHPYLRLHDRGDAAVPRSETAALHYLAVVAQATVAQAPAEDAVAAARSAENPYWLLQQQLSAKETSEEDLRAQMQESALAYLRHIEQNAFVAR